MTHSVRLNIGLGDKSEFVVHLEMRRHFGLLYPQDNINTEFTSSKTPISVEVSCP